MQAAAGNKKRRYTKLERDWVFYDVGNSAYVLLAASVMPIYFASISPGNNVVYWGYTETIASLVVALLMPVLGSLADFKGNKIKFFWGFALTGIVACAALSMTTWWLLFLAIYILSSIGINSSMVFYDAMLVDVTEDDRMDQVSSHGYAWGYIGSTIPFLVCLALIFGGSYIGVSSEWATRISFVIMAVWWLAFTIPLLKSYEQIHYKEHVPHEVSNALHLFMATIKKILADKNISMFMLAYFFYIDGVHTIIKMATSYGASLGIDSAHLVLALLVTQFVGFPAALLYGQFAKRFGVRNMILVAIAAYMMITIFAAFGLQSAREFWVLAVLVGLFQGGIQALSRSYLGRIIPKKNANEFYGFFDIFGKYAAVLGTFLMSGVTQFTGNASWGILSVAALFAIGLVIFVVTPDPLKKKPEGLSA